VLRISNLKIPINMQTTRSNLPAATAADFSESTRLVIAVASMNRIVSCTATNHINEITVNALLNSINPGLKNLVFQNCCIILGIKEGDSIRFYMHADIVISAPTRFVSPKVFNAMRLTVPIPSGHREGTVYVFLRHGQAWHNKPPAECDKFLRENPEIVAQMLELAQKRNSNIDLSALDEQQKIDLARKTLCQDAVLTPQGEEETLDTAAKLKALIDSGFLMPPKMTFLCSELQRTQQTAAIIASHLGHQGPIYVSPALNELHREINSQHWSLGTEQRVVAESRDSSMFKFATSILRNPLQITQQEWDDATDEFREPFERRVKAILAENTPCHDGPSSFCGLPIVHRACMLPFNGDLMEALPRISNIVTFCSGNKRKLLDIGAVFGNNLVMVPFQKNEPQGKPLYVATTKANKMHKKLGVPVVTEDVSLGKCGQDSAASSLIKDHVDEAMKEGMTLKQKMEERFGRTDFYNYQSTCVFFDGTVTIITLSQARCTLKELNEKEKEGVVGDIDPFVVVHEIKTWRQIDDSEPEPVGSIAFDASEGLSIGQWQKQDAKNRSQMHPRYFALHEMHQLLSERGVMW